MNQGNNTTALLVRNEWRNGYITFLKNRSDIDYVQAAKTVLSSTQWMAERFLFLLTKSNNQSAIHCAEDSA